MKAILRKSPFALLFIAIGFHLIFPYQLSGQSFPGVSPETNPTSQLVFFWLFDTSILNDTPLESINPIFKLNSGAMMAFHSALAGYPFNPDDPNWRKASMERRNAPTPLNYRPEGNQGITYEASNMRGIQIKQPFTGDGGENTLFFNLPTTGFKDIVFRLAAKDEGAANKLSVDYSIVSGNPVWMTAGMTNPTPDLSSDFLLFEFDFSQIGGISNNPDFKIRVRFIGDNMSADDGNRVTFNNITVDATAITGNNLPPVIVNSISLQELIELGNELEFNLNNIFSDPENDPMVFNASSDRPTMVQAQLNNSVVTITPLKRGDATVQITASDGNNPAVLITFRVLVYPKAFPLSSGQFSFTSWSPEEPEYSYPQHVLFLQSDKDDPELNDPLLYPYFIPHEDYHDDDLANIGFPYKNIRRTRINGMGDDGISIINTGRDRDLGGILVALDTRNVEGIQLDWLAGTILKNERQYAIRLLYRTDLFSPFADLTSNGQVIEYLTATDGDVQQFTDLSISAGALNKEYVQVLWKYYLVEGDAGTRAQLRLDDIVFKDVTGIDDYQSKNFLVQVVDGAIIAEHKGYLDGTLFVYDLLGRVIAAQEISKTGKTRIDTGQHNGVLIVRMVTSESSWSRKIMLN